MLEFKINKHHYNIYLISLIFLSLLMIYLYRPFASGHDFFFHFNRLIILMDELREGNFLVYMDYKIMEGYGYPTKIFYSDILLIPYAIIGNIFDHYFAYQSLIFTNNILCGIFSFTAFKKITKNTYASYIGSLLYTFSAYRLLDIYIRSAVGEIFAFTFIPIILLGIYQIIYGDYKKWYILAIGFSMLIYSHILSSVLVCIAILILLIFSYKRIIKEYKRIIYLLIAMIVCSLISAYYIIPMVEQFASNTLYIQVEELRKPIISFNLYSLIYGLFTVLYIDYDGFYPTVGILLVLPLGLRFFVKEKTKKLIYIDIITLTGLIIWIFTSYIYPWQTFPFSLLNFIQFSWRLNIISTLLLSISVGYYIAAVLNKKVSSIGLITILAVMMIINSKYYDKLSHSLTELLEYDNYKIEYNYRTKSGISGGEYLPSRVKQPYEVTIHNRGQVVIASNDSTKISNLTKDKGHITFSAEVLNNDNLELPLTYYKGYKATLDGEQVEYQQSQFGLIEVAINKSAKVEVQYVGTTLQRVSSYITIISILLLIIFIVLDRRKNKKIKQREI